MFEFDLLFPLGITHYLIGGLFIGFAVSFLFATTGLVGGMSTFFYQHLVVRFPLGIF